MTLRPALLAVLLVLATVATVASGLRTFQSWVFLRSAQEIGAIETASIRPWMTVAYVARAHGVSEEDLGARLELAADASRDVTLLTLARQRYRQPLEIVRLAQRAVADLRGKTPSSTTPVPGAGGGP
ncbi:MAG: hypothetical protein HY329_00385 [Chloroflexi bacterium]|nr:hypothetical protein [Chloroflexota bacterium]